MRSATQTSLTKPRLGIDLGGTKIFAVVTDGSGKVLGQSKRSTKAVRGYDAVLERIARTGREALLEAGYPMRSVGRIGVGVPGPVDSKRGQLIMAKNLGWENKSIAKDLALVMKRPVLIDNDVNCAARAELTYGSIRGMSSAVLAFVGTGLGGAVVHHGRIVEGANGFGGELGHIISPLSSVRCACGRVGCLETMVGKRGIARLISEAIKDGKSCRITFPEVGSIYSSELEQAWKSGCKATRFALTQSCDALAWGLATAGALLDPECFVLGGGVMEAMGHRLLPLVSARMPAWSALYRHKKPRLVLSTLGETAVAIGAASLVDREA